MSLHPFFRYLLQDREQGFAESVQYPHVHQAYKQYPNSLPRTSLSSGSVRPQGELEKLFIQRRSTYMRERMSVSFEKLQSLLYWSINELGIRDNQQLPVPSLEKKVFRSHPSGGYLYAVDTYVLIMHVTRMQQGIYYCDPVNHDLVLIRALRDYEIVDVLCDINVDCIVHASAVILFSHHIGRNIHKYGTRAYALAMIEAGHMCQNVSLYATKLSLISNAMLITNPTKLHELCAIDGQKETVFYGLCLGGQREENN